MAPITNGQHIFNEIPSGYPIPGKTTIYDATETIELDSTPLNGGVLLKILVLSVDPYIRGRMRDPSKASYNTAFELGKPIAGYGIGVVLRSENATVKVGAHLYGILPFQEYTVLPDTKGLTFIEKRENLPWSVYVGAAGMPGQTAYVGWKKFSNAKPGEVAFISTGAGAVGSIVVQLAKRDGLKVIASAGSDEKVQFMKEIGADVAFNYKTANTLEVLQKEGPIDVYVLLIPYHPHLCSVLIMGHDRYWDNVGGETLEAALEAATKNARFIECGMISSYNASPYHIKNLMTIVAKEISISGFIVSSKLPEFRDEFFSEVPAMLANGELKYREDITQGLERVGEAILAVQKGDNVGKSVIVVADE
ncbi:alcohol dehydrogenase [Hygrophoropsis aurantiaca]|uniref:Alcohol dehydrogenase n=1 Tax=Hygrophoropsis aurantiaca TaxID=72124 RepID=A0ACB8AJN5_9AGAM|nr:alcohol dehydrogenase [Hygrophoropsis aurantiaca]